jgi:hypothetical protein
MLFLILILILILMLSLLTYLNVITGSVGSSRPDEDSARGEKTLFA